MTHGSPTTPCRKNKSTARSQHIPITRIHTPFLAHLFQNSIDKATYIVPRAFIDIGPNRYRYPSQARYKMWHRRAAASDSHEPAQQHNRDSNKAQPASPTSAAASDSSFPGEGLLGGMHGAGGEYSVSTPMDAGAALGSLAGGVIGGCKLKLGTAAVLTLTGRGPVSWSEEVVAARACRRASAHSALVPPALPAFRAERLRGLSFVGVSGLVHICSHVRGTLMHLDAPSNAHTHAPLAQSPPGDVHRLPEPLHVAAFQHFNLCTCWFGACARPHLCASHLCLRALH